ncbi:nuclear valosin-containing protein-like [Babylonia areolata]|uniref:nuclear valosin-containing protein-like n=1 Tax=Babylonia areolata TaxID=304850 RepID=UPI003FD1A213
MANKEDKAYISDPKLVPRIKLFLQNKDPESTIGPDRVVQHLQATYSDYARKKRNAFSHSVAKALQVAKTEVFGSEAKTKGAKKRRQDSSSDSDPEGLVAYENTNAMNLAMRSLYKNTNSVKTPSSSTPDQGKKSKMKKVNGTPASARKDNSSPMGPVGWVVDRSGSRCTDNKGGDEDMDQGLDAESVKGGDASQCSEPPSAWTLTYSYTCTCGARRTVNINDGQNTSDVNSTSRNWSVSCPYTCTCGAQRVMNVTDKWKSSVATSASGPSDKNAPVKSVTLQAVVDADSDAVANSDGKSGSSAKRKKLKRKRTRLEDADTDLPDVEPTIPDSTLNDFGGNSKLLAELHRDFDEFFYADYCQFASQSDKKTCRRYLLHGPRGSGKRFLAECIAGQLKVCLLKPKINTLISGVSGDSEQRVRDLFEQAANQAPCVLYLEDIECLAPRQDTAGGSKDMMTRIASELGTCIDELQERPENVVLIATTSRIESVHKDLRIPGRFIEKALGMPDEKSRESLLQKLCSKYTLSPDLSLKALAKLTPGFVAGDLRALVHDAFSFAFLRVRDLYRTSSSESERVPVKYPPPPQPPAHLTGSSIVATEQDSAAVALTEEDFMGALKKAQPAAKREGFATVPTTTWEDVGALHNVRAQLQDSILCRIHDPEMASAFGLPTNSGIILVGPPGCGKTLVAKAMANEAGLNFMYIKGPELLDKYVGESEKNLREKFDKAQTCAPCLIFFDEMDTLCSNRQNSEGSNVGKSVTNQLLALMDGCGERNQVYVMGATNIIENVDPALQRPGRFDRKIFIGLPDVEGRLDILRALTKGGSKRKLESCDLQQFAQETEGFSGADLKHLVDEASTIAMKESMRDPTWRQNNSREYLVTGDHFSCALQLVKPSVMKKDAEKYRRVALQM